MNSPTFYNKAGMLTPYGLACGYIEKKEKQSPTGETLIWKTLYREHNVYHVTRFDFTTKERIWQTFDKLTPARKLYKSIKL